MTNESKITIKKKEYNDRDSFNSQESSDNDDMDVNEYWKKELKKSENYKLKDIKKGIEKMVSEIDNLDEEGKFNVFLCKI